LIGLIILFQQPGGKKDEERGFKLGAMGYIKKTHPKVNTIIENQKVAKRSKTKGQ
jgi:hypothetical protein